MERHRLFGLLAIIAAGTLMLAGAGPIADEKASDHKHGGMSEHCAKACAECMRECEVCARHCGQLIVDGRKEHFTTLGTCADCAEFCAAAAKIVSRRGPMSSAICESCAKACDVCGQACEKSASDEEMTRCAKVCRECAKACRDMLKLAGTLGEK